MGASVSALVAVVKELNTQVWRLEEQLTAGFDQHPDADARYLWAFTAITASPGARAFYHARRSTGDTHHRALRALANRLVGILHGCLRHGSPYDENIVWSHRQQEVA